MSDEATPLSDVIQVRADERLDTSRLADYLKGRFPGSEDSLEIEQFGGGHANLTYLLRYGEGSSAHEYVLRRPPLGPVAKGAHDMGREFRALSGLWKGFPLAPKALVYCDDPSVIGADFFVMERRGGVVVRHSVPAQFGGGEDPRANRSLSEVVVDTLVDFHAVSPEAVGLSDIGRPEGFLERQIQGWSGRLDRARTHDLPVADEVSRWLHDNLPTSPVATLLHNDWKLDNMAVAADDPGRCVAVYDWDMCTLGDPLCDFGTLLSSWVNRGEGVLGPSSMPTQTPGFMTREEAVERYAERSGTDISTVPYYHVFGTFKMAVVLQQIYVRYHRGQTQDERFAGMGKVAEALFEQAASRRP